MIPSSPYVNPQPDAIGLLSVIPLTLGYSLIAQFYPKIIDITRQGMEEVSFLSKNIYGHTIKYQHIGFCSLGVHDGLVHFLVPFRIDSFSNPLIMKKTVLLLVCLVLFGAGIIAQNPRNVVLYNLTSTGCGPCSCMDSIIRVSVLPRFPNTVVIALHSPISTGGSAFWNYQGSKIFYQFHSLWEPDGFIDGLGHDAFYQGVADSIAHRLEASPESPVRVQIVSKSWNPATRMVDLTVRITNIGGDLQGSYGYNIFVTEDNLKMFHRVASGCATPDDPNHLPLRHNYFNDHVTRKVEFLETGDSLIGPVWPAGMEIVKNFSILIDTAWVPENTHLNLVVYHHADSIYKSEVLQAVCQSVSGEVGIPDTKTKPELSGIRKIYPNPANEWISVHFTVASTGTCRLEILSVTGQPLALLMEGSTGPGIYNVEHSVSDIPAGTYLLRLEAPEGSSFRKLVVIK